ncbi:hypothetical protein [Burkholderia seminalis]|uniref:hypothetical protein n=1 Tax=Burkholderia seminalis TaxID=488731 RepID=UPI001CF0E6A2|nr:hypothetical protein [Burkholderia seminalis]MCA8434176.1 hypothetical protein [Burkholderia seminalis]
MSKLNFGRIDRCSVRLNTATLLGLKAAYDDFATTGQDLHNFEICIEDESEARAHPTPEDHVISVTFVRRCRPACVGSAMRVRLGRRSSMSFLRKPAKFSGFIEPSDCGCREVGRPSRVDNCRTKRHKTLCA